MKKFLAATALSLSLAFGAAAEEVVFEDNCGNAFEYVIDELGDVSIYEAFLAYDTEFPLILDIVETLGYEAPQTFDEIGLIYSQTNVYVDFLTVDTDGMFCTTVLLVIDDDDWNAAFNAVDV